MLSCHLHEYIYKKSAATKPNSILRRCMQQKSIRGKKSSRSSWRTMKSGFAITEAKTFFFSSLNCATHFDLLIKNCDKFSHVNFIKLDFFFQSDLNSMSDEPSVPSVIENRLVFFCLRKANLFKLLSRFQT